MPDEIKIYPAEKQQLDTYNQQLLNYNSQLQTLNNKIPLPTYQVKTVNPSNVQQTIEPDNGYTGLSAVVVNPIAAAMPENLEDFVMRKDAMPKFSLSLSGDVPDYACYQQSKLVAVYGTLTSIGSYAFNNCTNLQEIDCRAATSIESYAFQYCTNLQEIDCRAATSIERSAFQNCTNLQEIDCRAATSIKEIAFNNCTNLQEIDCRAATSIKEIAFQYCTNLQEIDCRAATSIGAAAFNSCPNLNLIDITNTHTATLANTNAIPNNANLTILVADATDKAHYQSSTNWSTFASKIKTVAEFEQEIGMSYDDYYLQIFGHARN